MANKFEKKMYGVVNTDNVLAVRTGNMLSDFSLNETDFTTIPAENGMLLVADFFNKTVGLPTDNTAENIYMVASEIKQYEGKGDAYYALELGKIKPRLVALSKGDTFVTNSFVYDDAVYADFATLLAAVDKTTVFGEPDATGFIKIVAAQTAGTVTKLKVRGKKMLPNGETGLEFVVL